MCSVCYFFYFILFLFLDLVMVGVCDVVFGDGDVWSW
jgi:hypothetical protein